MEYRIKQYAAERRKVATAQRVLIIGSGVVGNELCGEIVDAFPNKEIIMIGRSTLLRRAGPEAHRMISEHWASKGVKCIFNEEMLPLKPGDTHYMTVKGTKVPIDGTRAFWCTGRDTPNSAMLKRNFPTSLDNYGYIKIDESTRVYGVPRGNIFAVGDCTFGSAHPGGDRGTFGFNFHSFVARENVAAMAEQLKAGTPPELCSCPQKLPFKIDPTCDYGSKAAAVTGLQELSLGHDTHFLQFCKFPEAFKGSATSETVEKFNNTVKPKCMILKKGNEGRMKTYISMVDKLRAKEDPKGMQALGYALAPPGSDAKKSQQLWGIFFSNPFLAKVIFQQVVLKGKDKDCMLDSGLLTSGEVTQMLEGDGLEVTEAAAVKVDP